MNFTPFQSGGSGGGGLTAAAAQTLIDVALDALGDQLLDSVDDYANAPTVDSDGNAPTDGDKFYLAQDTIGTGTAASPEYPAGLYRHNGTEWVFHKKLGAGGKFLTPVFLNLTAAQDYVMLPDHWYGIQSTADANATMQVPLMAQNECIEINSAATEDVTLTYIAGVTTHGTPSATIKPTYYASVIARNANLVEVVGLEESTTNQEILSTSLLMDLTDITGTTTNIVLGTNPSAGQTALHNDGTATIIRIGDVSICTLRITTDDDDTFTLTMGTSIVPIGGKILSMSTNNLNRWENSSFLIESDGSNITFNRTDAIDSDVTAEITFITDGWS